MRAVALSLTLALGVSRAWAVDNGTNAQAWSEIDVVTHPAPDLSITLLGVSREGEGLPNPTLYGGGALLSYNVGPWTLIGGDLRVAARSASSGNTLEINVPLAAVALAGAVGDLAVTNTNQIERLSGLAGDPWRYRDKIAVEYPLAGFGPIRALFATDEVFYDFGRDQWTRNRAQVGFAMGLSEGARLEIYFMRQDDKHALPASLDIVGTTLKFDLP